MRGSLAAELPRRVRQLRRSARTCLHAHACSHFDVHGPAPSGSAGTLAMRARTHCGSSGTAHALPLYALRPALAAAAASPAPNPGNAARPRQKLAAGGRAAGAAAAAAAALKPLRTPLAAPTEPKHLCNTLAAAVELNTPCAAPAAAARAAAGPTPAVDVCACRMANPAQVLAPGDRPPAAKVLRSALPTPLAAACTQAHCCQARGVGCRA